MDILPEPHITLACCSCLDVCLFVPVCGSCSAADNNEVSEYLNSNNLQLFGPVYMSSRILCMNAEEILDNYHGLMSAYLANVI